jgi:hypothetical protein
MNNHFDFINSISQNKIDLSNDLTFEKDYNPFMVNKGLSYFADTVLAANEMNRRPLMPKEHQYKFLLNVVPARKRFAKWEKAEKPSEDIELVSEYYKLSIEQAKYYLTILTEEQVDIIKTKLFKGGRK